MKKTRSQLIKEWMTNPETPTGELDLSAIHKRQKLLANLPAISHDERQEIRRWLARQKAKCIEKAKSRNREGYK